MSNEQVEALRAIHQRWEVSDDFETFQANAAKMIGGDGALVVKVGVIWLAVETDGYTHS